VKGPYRLPCAREKLWRSIFRRGRRKLGLTELREGDDGLFDDLLARMAEGGADFTLTFRRLGNEAAGPAPDDRSPRSLFGRPEAFDEWAVAWRRRLAHELRSPEEIAAGMAAVNPAYIPRNHLVERAIRAAVDRDDLGPFERLVEVLARPFDERSGDDRHASPPRPEEVVHQTFCGT